MSPLCCLACPSALMPRYSLSDCSDRSGSSSMSVVGGCGTCTLLASSRACSSCMSALLSTHGIELRLRSVAKAQSQDLRVSLSSISSLKGSRRSTYAVVCAIGQHCMYLTEVQPALPFVSLFHGGLAVMYMQFSPLRCIFGSSPTFPI